MTTAGPGSDDFTADPHHDPSAAWAAGDDHARAELAGETTADGPVDLSPDCPESKMQDGSHAGSLADAGEPRICSWCGETWTPDINGLPS
jgi:hypothetical protein